MSQFITKEPYQLSAACVRNPIIFELETDKYLVSTGSKFYRAWNATLAVADTITDGDYFELELDGTMHRFTFRTTPDDSGYELPLQGYDSYSTWMAVVKSYLEANIFVDKYVKVVDCFADTLAIWITLEGKKNGVPLLTNEGTTSFGSGGSYVDGELDVYQANYSSHMKLYCEKTHMASDYEHIIDLYTYPIIRPSGDPDIFLYVNRFRIDRELYDFMDKIYGENLQQALPFYANYPNAKHIIKRFYFKYHEAYGSPVTERMLTSSQPYSAALAGQGFLNFSEYSGTLVGFGFLHPKKDAYNQVTIKQYVDKEQPAWVYFFLNPNDGTETGAVTRVFKRIYYSDDGSYNETDIDSDMSKFIVGSNETKAFFIPAGYDQLDIGGGDGPSPEDGQAFKWEVIIEVDEEIYLTKTFVLDCCAGYKTYLMYQNSMGGYDTIVLTAPKEYTLELKEGAEVERLLGDNYKKENSQFEATVPKIRQNVKANVGFKHAEDSDVLKELMMSKRVFVCPAGSSEVFIPVNIDRKSITMESEDDYQRNFVIEFSPAHEFKNFESSIWLKSK